VTTVLSHLRTRDVVALARPQFWPVSLVPYGVGLVLATGRLVPSAGDLPQVLAGALVIGPLVWLSVLAVNDAYDVRGDLLNPRKASAPLVTGRISPAAALWIAVAAGMVAFALSLTAGWWFAAGTLVALLLGAAYSAPPLRLKSRPGGDVLLNAVAIGVAGPMAGWAVIRPIGDFPWPMAVLGTLVGAALYLPTTLADLDADSAANGVTRGWTGGYRTIAVRLGRQATYRLGLACWVASAGLSVLLAATNTVIPRRMLLLEIVMVPLLVASYRKHIGPSPSFHGVVIVASWFLLPAAGFVLTYTGIL
jgi:chlorophyll synthase